MMQTLFRFLVGTLRGRLILGVAAVHGVMMTIFIADLTIRQRAMLLDHQIAEATALSQALATSAAGWLAADDISGLQELVEAQRRYPEMIFVMLADDEGRILADSDTSRRGLYLQDLPGEVRQIEVFSSPALVDVATPAMLGGRHVGWARVGLGQKTAGQKLKEITRNGVAYALAAILIGMAIAWFMGLRITRRLYAVQETIAAVRSGNRLARSSLAGTDEAAVMAREFNHMLDVIGEKDAELREKTEELDHYFTDALDLLCIADTDGYFRRLNPQWEIALGLPVSELVGRCFLDFIHPGDLEATRQAVSRLAGQHDVLDFINRYRHISGEYRWIEWRAFPSGSRIYAVARDITDRKLTEDALRRSEENLNRAQAVAETGSWYLDVRHNELEWSAETYRIFGIPQEQRLTLEAFAASILPEDRERVLHAWDAALQGAPYDIEHRILVGTETKWVRERADVNFDTEGNPLSGVGTVQDITERKRAEEALLRLNRELQAISNCNQLLMRAEDEQFLLDNLCRIVCEEGGYRMTWVGSAENDEGRSIRPLAWTGVEEGYLEQAGFTWADTKEGCRPAGMAIRNGETVCIQDLAAASQAGSWQKSALQRGYRATIAIPLKDESANVFGVLVIYSAEVNAFPAEESRLLEELGGDLAFGIRVLRARTARRQAEQSVVLMNFALDNVQESAFLIDENARFHYVNEGACRLLGYSREELLALGVSDVDPDFPAERWPEHWHDLRIHHSLTFEGRHAARGGRILPVEINANYFEYDGQGYNLALVRDITERKQAVETLREREVFIRSILNSVDEGFIVIDREYHILSANKAFCDMMHISEERMVGRLCHAVTHHTDRPCFDSGEDCPVRRTFETGKPHFAFHTHEDASGSKQYVELKSFPVTDTSGTVTSVIETINDVTEKRKLEEQLRQSQKMEAVGTLAGGVAHDFNNMLMVIIGHAELALKQMAPDQPIFANLREIRKAAGRSADLTRQLLTFARKQTVVPKTLDLNESVEGMLKMLRRLIGEDIDLAWLPGKVVWPVKMDPSQIDQLLANLCVNARDAIAGVGKVSIETRNATIDEAYCADHPEAVPGEYVLLAVSDDGCGMDQQTLGKIFEPFFTTKELGKGTGLGLSTVYGIARQNKGFINVYSEPGQGSTFKIYLPRLADASMETPAEKTATPAAGGSETILLAEDEAAILEMVKQILEDFGYRVLAAPTPGEAIRMAKKYASEIHLLITDLVMPEMNGQELAKNLLDLYPQLKILYMSGYSGNVIARQGVLDEGVNFIQKPFSMQAFAAKVREALDGK